MADSAPLRIGIAGLGAAGSAQLQAVLKHPGFVSKPAGCGTASE